MRTRWIVLALLVGLLTEARAFQEGKSYPPAPGPQVIYWPGADRPPIRVGLHYAPEHLADLARLSPNLVSARIAAAIRQQTPIVVFWSIPPNASIGLWPRLVLVENGDAWAAPRIEPLWADQTADDLRQLDPTTPFEDMGVMAAFPRSAFGRFVTIYVDLPAEGGHKRRRVQRFGKI